MRRLVLFAAFLLALVAPATSSAAITESFTSAGCSAWTVPSAVTSVDITAVGAAGGAGANPGGLGDKVAATLSGLSGGQTLFVCVNSGGGAGASPAPSGGGASGVSTGSTFSSPVVVAGGGGGTGGSFGASGGGGGDAGLPNGSAGDNGSGTFPGAGGGGGTSSSGGSGGGSGFSATGPGRGGNGTAVVPCLAGGGGGGGAGYYGGGGGSGTFFSNLGGCGGGGGGGGGSDFCSSAATVSGCTVTSGAGTSTVAGTGAGDAKVTLTYTFTPSFATVASRDVLVGGRISDTATLADGFSPSGSITFRAYGPDDTTCTNPAAFERTETVFGNGMYSAHGFAASAPGTYRWIASYSGDGNNDAVSGNCSDAGESVVAYPPTTTITVEKALLPASDSGLFDLKVGPVIVKAGATDGDSGQTAVVPGTLYKVYEAAAGGANLSDYATSTSCDNGASAGGNGLRVSASAGTNVTCTITNRRKATVTLALSLQPSSDAGRFDLYAGHTLVTADAGDQSSGQALVAPGTFKVAELPEPGTTLSDYVKSIACTVNGGAGPSGRGASLSVTVAPADQLSCTITNVRR